MLTRKKNSFFCSTSARDNNLITDFTYVGYVKSSAMLTGYNDDGSNLTASDFSVSAFDMNSDIHLNSCGFGLGGMFESFLVFTGGNVTGFNVTVHWGENGNVLGIGRYMGFWQEYVTPENRGQKRNFVPASETVRTESGNQNE